MGNKKIRVNDDHLLYLRGIHDGSLYPIEEYCGAEDHDSILNKMCLKDGQIWPIPITLEIREEEAKEIIPGEKIDLISNNGTLCAYVTVSDVYKIDKSEYVLKIFGTEDITHPGVKKELEKPNWRVGGEIEICELANPISEKHFKSPLDVKREMGKLGWKTAVGFQTRNPIHRAHEHLQRIGMEVCDGVLIQPLIGWRKGDDVAPSVILKSYEIMMESYYPRNKMIFAPLEMPMHYAGPREAVFHAIIRRNYGCTCFIVGRDHAGVGNFYGRYEAQDLTSSMKGLGIEIMRLKSPFFCYKCGKVVTESTCAHYHVDKDQIREISGTAIRNMINRKEYPPEFMMRKEVAEILMDHLNKMELLNENGK